MKLEDRDSCCAPALVGTPSLADSDPAFLGLRPNIRAMIRQFEARFRTVVREKMLERLPPVVAAVMPDLDIELPAGFIRGLRELFIKLDELENQADVLVAQLGKQRSQANLN